MYYSPVRHSSAEKQAFPCYRSTCMCKACRQRSIWAMIKLFSLIHCFRILHLSMTLNFDWHLNLFLNSLCFVKYEHLFFKSNSSIRLATYAHTYRLLVVNELRVFQLIQTHRSRLLFFCQTSLNREARLWSKFLTPSSIFLFIFEFILQP